MSNSKINLKQNVEEKSKQFDSRVRTALYGFRELLLKANDPYFREGFYRDGLMVGADSKEKDGEYYYSWYLYHPYETTKGNGVTFQGVENKREKSYTAYFTDVLVNLKFNKKNTPEYFECEIILPGVYIMKDNLKKKCPLNKNELESTLGDLYWQIWKVREQWNKVKNLPLDNINGF